MLKIDEKIMFKAECDGYHCSNIDYDGRIWVDIQKALNIKEFKKDLKIKKINFKDVNGITVFLYEDGNFDIAQMCAYTHETGLIIELYHLTRHTLEQRRK